MPLSGGDIRLDPFGPYHPLTILNLGLFQACTKAREYLLQKISELRRPKTNVQIIQKNSLLK